jgi:hypothetical protein
MYVDTVWQGVQYDVDKLIYLGTTEHMLYYLFNTRKEAGLDTLAKLRAATGVRIGSAPVGHTGYIHSRLVAYLLNMKEPKIIPGYENEDLDIAFARGEVDAQVASTGTVIEHDLVNKKLADFHAAIEFPKGRKVLVSRKVESAGHRSFREVGKRKKAPEYGAGFQIHRHGSAPASGNSQGSCGDFQRSRAKNSYRPRIHQ